MFFLFFGPIFILVLASQLYWAWRIRTVARRRIASKTARWALAIAAAVLYAYMWDYNVNEFRHRATPVHLTLAEALLVAPFAWWIAGSVVGFLVIAILTLFRWICRAFAFAAKKAAGRADAPPSPDRRRFIDNAITAAGVAPFVAGGYGILYGRLNLETTHPRVPIPRLPKAFHGFRIAQLTDIHIGPFMTADQIRRYVSIANEARADLIVLTGDFVTWDAATQQDAVDALRGLRAPFGVYGCLGNHDAWAGVEDSITALFSGIGYRILRQQAVELPLNGERLNLIGIDFHRPQRGGIFGAESLAEVKPLLSPDTTNILLSHNPNNFDRAAELGIDLTLSGHTHGGQAALEFISPNLAPSRLITPYVAGHFSKSSGQLYVNRGIGTIGVPIRLGAPPEISIFELVRG